VPERLIPATRFGGSRTEIEVLLEPARRAGRLDVRLNTALGTDVSVKDACRGSDALLLAVGLWKERTLGAGNGIYSGLDFLERCKAGTLRVPRGPAVVLAGGDCAMDAACLLKAAGADPLLILFGGSRSEMHWCMDDAWFAQPGVHARMLCRPVGYQLDGQGCVTGVRVIPMDPEAGGGARDLAGGGFIVGADMVVEAMGLSVADDVRAALPSLSFGEDGLLHGTGPGVCCTGMDGVFAAGALVNGGASVPQCVEEGIRVAGEIHNWLTGSGPS
jgi:dihydropyrimidine dehydrogenase (NAD+) subunit PreT